jgi:uncharacterized membrane protein YjgN (DUF898 family)
MVRDFSTAHPFEFRGSGGEYFRIWIVNLALSIITLGIFSAWAKVRTKRYFSGSTYVAGHNFEYHASGYRILIGRIIALSLLLAYQLSVVFVKPLLIIWFLLGLFVVPWLIISSIRFNARNTSYRNVRFNFSGTDGEAFGAFIGWPFLGVITLGLLWPLAQKKKEYFLVNNHNYGGRYFETDFSVWNMYAIFALALVAFLIVGGGLVALTASQLSHALFTPGLQNRQLFTGLAMVVVYVPLLLIAPFVHTMIVNLVVGSTVFDDKHQLQSTMSPFVMAWIMVSNVFLTIITLGLFYPWAKVRAARYQLEHTTLFIEGEVETYVSEVFETQSAVGEEIGSFFSFDFGL